MARQCLVMGTAGLSLLIVSHVITRLLMRTCDNTPPISTANYKTGSGSQTKGHMLLLWTLHTCISTLSHTFERNTRWVKPPAQLTGLKGAQRLPAAVHVPRTGPFRIRTKAQMLQGVGQES